MIFFSSPTISVMLYQPLSYMNSDCLSSKSLVPIRQNGYFPIRWLRVRNSLHHDSLDKWMSTSRKRQIHQGMKNGAVIDVARTEADVQAFFSMLKHYYSPKIHRYLPDIGFFTTLLTHSSHCGRIFIIRYKNKIIGCSCDANLHFFIEDLTGKPYICPNKRNFYGKLQ